MFMGNEIATIEKQLDLIAPQLQDVLAAYKIPVARLMRTVVVSIERLPKLLECNRQSILNSAMTAACLGLEVDGVTGQGFLIPFKDKAQFITGYKGYNTMAARSGYTLNASVVREGDAFDYQLGTSGFIHHKPLLGGERTRKILAAYAQATMPGRDSIIQVLSIDEIMAVKDKSPGAKKSDSPWNDPYIGFPAMASKTAKRRLGRDMPLNIMVMAASLEDHLDLGQTAHITPDKGIVIDQPTASTDPIKPQTYKRDTFEIFFTSMGKPTAVRQDINAYKAQVIAILDKATPEQLRMFKKDNKAYVESMAEQGHLDKVGTILDRLNAIED
jgi:recombination protein RecT